MLAVRFWKKKHKNTLICPNYAENYASTIGKCLCKDVKHPSSTHALKRIFSFDQRVWE